VLREALFATPIVDRLGELTTEGGDPRKPIKEGRFGNSLQLAAYHGSEDMMEFLLSEKIPAEKRVNETEHSKIPTLYHTYQFFCFYFSDGGYRTALQAPSANAQVEVVKKLIAHNNEEYLNIVGECWDVKWARLVV